MKARMILCLLLPALLCGCGSTSQPETDTGGFAVTSASLNADGTWNAAITNTAERVRTARRSSAGRRSTGRAATQSI